MSADRQEDEIRHETSKMARGGDEMEEHLSELDDHIDQARAVAAKRQDAPEQTGAAEEGGEVAGDWEGEASGAQQGEDAEDAAGG